MVLRSSGLVEDIHRDWSAVGVKFAVVGTGSVAGAGNADLVAAVSGKRIRVLHLYVVPTASSTMTLRSGTTAITGAMSTAAGVSIDASHSEGLAVLQTAAGEALNLLNGGTSCAFAGFLVYAEVN